VISFLGTFPRKIKIYVYSRTGVWRGIEKAGSGLVGYYIFL
jgi:hypothetical protein